MCSTAVAACASGHHQAELGSTATASFVDGGVEVGLLLKRTDSRRHLIATFTPRGRGFHLYSADLPDGGIHGIGQRTAVAVSGAWTSTGRLHTAAPVRLLRYPSLHIALPVYPNGHLITSTALVRGTGSTVTISVSYAACSANLCRPPVRAHRVTLHVA